MQAIRGPEAGLVMVRARIDGGGARFNLGEATVTRATVRLHGEPLAATAVGTSYVLGTDLGHARLAAVFDGLLSDAGAAGAGACRGHRAAGAGAGRAGRHPQRRGAQHARRLLLRRQGARVTTAAGAFPAPGFADPARDAQRAFRAVLDAIAHPARSYPLAGPAEPPAALGRGLAAVALTLLDEDCAVWLGGALARRRRGRRLARVPHRRPPRGHRGAAGFVIAGPDALPPLASLALGTDEAPHLSATVVLDVRGCTGFPNTGPARFTARGPGIDGAATLAAPWAPDGFADAWHRNAEVFPRGVDLLLVDEDTVTAVPRTTRLKAADHELED